MTTKLTVEGTVKNGVVVLKNGSTLPDGMTVTVRPLSKATKRISSKAKGRRRLLRHAGKATDLPADAARNLDHYLYGHEKQ